MKYVRPELLLGFTTNVCERNFSENRAENKRQWLADTLQIREIYYGYLLPITLFTLKMTTDN